VQPSGSRTFVTVARDPNGKQVWTTIGAADVLKIEEAREQARNAIRRVKAGQPALEAPPAKPDSLQAVAENWLKRHVVAKRLRSEREIRRVLAKYVFPQWAERDFISIKRSDVAALLDQVEDKHGSRQADIVLANLRSIANWFASRDDDYVSPFVRGMRRHKNGPRARILTDDELRLVWKAADEGGQFGAIVKLLLCTGQRRDKVSKMKFDGVWMIDTDEREKGNAGSLVLPSQALAIIRAQPRVGNNPFVFAGRSGNAYNNSQAKPGFDALLPPLPRWTLPDLRRTSRSLMSRAGVRPDIAERVLGHAIVGVEGTYDRHHYGAEKAAALGKLATLIEGIVHPRDNVTPLAKRRRR